MVKCDECGRNFGILYKKHKYKNKTICIECLDKIKTELGYTSLKEMEFYEEKKKEEDKIRKEKEDISLKKMMDESFFTIQELQLKTYL